MTKRKAPTAVLISGRGSNMQALVTAAMRPDYPAEIVTVIANRPDAAGLDWARSRGLTTEVVDHAHYKGDRRAFDAELQAAITRSGAEYVALAGFMRLLTDDFVNAWSGRMINIHPSLLPAFKGLDTHARTLAAGVRVAGCSVHYVVPEMDAGPVIRQAAVPVLIADTEADLAARILKSEHKIYPAALADMIRGACRLEDGRTVWAHEGESADTNALYVPPLADLNIV